MDSAVVSLQSVLVLLASSVLAVAVCRSLQLPPLIGYLSDQSMQEVSRAVGVNRIRREIRDQFNAMLFPDGAEKIHDILFDEFVVQ